MSLYDQRLLADANTDNYSTIVAFEEQEQHQQARTLQDSGYLSDHNSSDANVMIGGGGSILAIGVVVLAFLSARNKRDALIRVLEAIKHHSLELYYWPAYQLLGVPHGFTTPVQNQLDDYYDASFYFQNSTDQDYPMSAYDGFENLPFYQELVDIASTGNLEDVYDRFVNHLSLLTETQNQPLKLTVDFGVTEPTNQDLIDCQKFANQLKEKGLL